MRRPHALPPLLYVLTVWLSIGACTRQATRSVPSGPSNVSAATAVAQKRDTSSTSLVLSRDDAVRALCDLYSTLDTDCDRRLTIIDQKKQCTRPPCPLALTVRLGAGDVQLTHLHEASQLATELAEGLGQSSQSPDATIELNLRRALQTPVEYLEERITTRYWDGLTRTISTSHTDLRRALIDEKQGEGTNDNAAWCSIPPTCQTPKEPASVTTLPDPPNALQYLYVPSDDDNAHALYSPLTRSMPLRVVAVPNPVSPQWVSALTRNRSHGLLSLSYDEHGRPRPFVVPGGRFNEMYGWDSYFISLGLLASGHLERARDMAEHQAYQIVHYGKVLNANRTYYLTRSQPPFFAGLVRKVLAAHVASDRTPTPSATSEPSFGAREDSNDWRKRMLQAAEREYSEVWAAAPRRTALCNENVCLSRYYGEGVGQPPEVEAGHFSAFYQAHAISHAHCAPPEDSPSSLRTFSNCVRELERAYTSGVLRDPDIDAFFVDDQCVRESGHDTTFRWFEDGQERCTHFATVDLNALLLQYELDVAHLYSLGGTAEKEHVNRWCQRANARAGLIEKHLWNDRLGAHFDIDITTLRQSSYLSATSLYPLWVEPNNACGVSLVTKEQARRVISAVLPQLEAAGGLLATAPRALANVTKPTVLELRGSQFVSRTPTRQWEAPNGWAPHQMLAWTGLLQHGFEQDAQRLAYRWLLLIAESSANFHGTVPEKFDVVNRTHQVFAEYGNVNTEFAYIAKEGFGWMNASFLVGLEILNPDQRAKLFELAPVDAVF